MGREVRKVPADWKHPEDRHGQYIPLFDGYDADIAEFEEIYKEKGLQEAIDWMGCPDKDNYMLAGVPESECTHLMMYEDTTEGTPISPAFETPEELAHWLADNKASAFGSDTASYEAWLATIHRGSALSAFMVPGVGIFSGVEAEHELV